MHENFSPPHEIGFFLCRRKSIRRKMDFCESSAEFSVFALALDTLSDLRSNKLEAGHKAPMTFLLCPRSFLLTENLFLWRVSFWISFCRRRRDSDSLKVLQRNKSKWQSWKIGALCKFPRSVTQQSPHS